VVHFSAMLQMSEGVADCQKVTRGPEETDFGLAKRRRGWGMLGIAGQPLLQVGRFSRLFPRR
jgi:hypothetical protein